MPNHTRPLTPKAAIVESVNTKDHPIAANDGSLRPHSRSSSGSPSRLGATKFAPDLSSITTASGTELMVPPSRSAISNSRPATPSRMIGAARRGADQKRAHGTRHSCGTDRRKRGSLPEPNRPKVVRHAGQTYNVGPRSSGDRASVS
jgi:hypothetical protein